MQQPVEFFNDGRKYWNLGLLGLFLRYKSIATTLIITALTMGLPWWLKDTSFLNYQFSLKSVILTLIPSTFLSFSLSLIYLRKRTRRSLNMKYFVHQITHNSRNNLSKLEKLTAQKRVSTKKIGHELEKQLEVTCNDAYEYFKVLTGDDTITTAIRLIDYEKEHLVFKTYARSTGLNKNRKQTSESISMNEGIPKFLRSLNCSGVLFYNDIELAIKNMTYKETKNDVLYKDEIKTMMVAPINAFKDEKPKLIGLFYVASRNKKVFNMGHVDCMGFLADHIAISISTALNFALISKKK